MTNSQQMPNTESGSSKSPISGYILTALITAIVVSGAWMFLGVSTITEDGDRAAIETVTPVSGDQLQTVTTTEQSAKTDEASALKAALLLEKFQNALSSARQVDYADQNPANTNKMYYITDGVDSLPIGIWEYDAGKDPAYLSTSGNQFDVSVGSRLLLDYKVAEKNNLIFRVGLSGNNYVFFEMNGDYSAGPCAQPEFWLNGNNPNSPKLLAIDVTAANPVVKPYTPTAADIAKATKDFAQCKTETFGE